MSTSKQPDGTKWTDSALARAITSETDDTVSIHYIAALRKGDKRNPRASLISAMATVLGVPGDVFIEGDPNKPIRDLLDPAYAIEHVSLRHLVAVATDLNADNQATVLRIARELLRAQ